MKMSVYVPDDLWEIVQQAEPDLKLSAFVQQSLRERMARRTYRPYARLEADVGAMRAAAREAIASRQRDAYGAGYRIGLLAAEQLPWQAHHVFEEHGYDLDALARHLETEDYEPVTHRDEWGGYIDLKGIVGIALDEVGPVPLTDGLPVGLVREGFIDGIRDVWEGTSRATIVGQELEAEAVTEESTDAAG